MSPVLLFKLFNNTTDAEKLGKKFLGENDIEAVLQRLDRLTQEEARTTATQTLEIVYGLVKNMRIVMDGARSLLVPHSVLNLALQMEASWWMMSIRHSVRLAHRTRSRD